MKCWSIFNLLWWYGRDLLRHPAQAFLMAICLMALTVVIAVPLPFTQALAEIASKILSADPALVVRRAEPEGWRPMPVQSSVKRARGAGGDQDGSPRVGQRPCRRNPRCRFWRRTHRRPN